ncbi:hypothetical protein BDW59DRAFT_156149 [Aspergillus cavernicola]|uniref:Myb-like domain-containing protein n=1 Tax=Aspergillus cavernicola TaxID=176166 RepID=A0ABR4J570_9EURO
MTKIPLDRPKRRTLVRWDDDLDQLLMLSIQSVCNSQNVKIPWREVARVMGHRLTEGAILQHLSKLRARRAQDKKSVPPPLKRGYKSRPGGASETTLSTRKGEHESQKDHIEDYDTSDEEFVAARRSTRLKTSLSIKKSRSQHREVPDIEEESDGSDEELLVPGASFLELPNDREPKDASYSPSPESSESLIVKCKVPKSRLEKVLNEIDEKKLEANRPVYEPKPITLKNDCYQTIPTATSTNYNRPFVQTSAVHNDYTGHTSFPALQEDGTSYISTGNPSMDLPMIGPVDDLPNLGDQFLFDGSPFPPPDQSFEDMLGEYMVLDNSVWFAGNPTPAQDI